jgi:hypothetical protein
MLAQGENTAVRQQFLVPHAGLETLAYGFRARQEQDDQVIGARLPGLGGAEPEMPIPAPRERDPPKAAQRIAGGPMVGIHEDSDIGADLIAERLHVQPEGTKGIHHATRPRARHANA